VRRLTLFLVIPLLAACTGSTETVSYPTIDGSPPPPSITPAPAACPKEVLGRPSGSGIPGRSDTLVPDTPSVLVLCGPGSRAVVADQGQVLRLASALNGLRHVPRGTAYACPADFGPTYGLFFDYSNGDVLLVTVSASGCRFASNGRLSAVLDDAILARVRALLREQVG
jgi:hypothetical protein